MLHRLASSACLLPGSVRASSRIDGRLMNRCVSRRVVYAAFLICIAAVSSTAAEPGRVVLLYDERTDLPGLGILDASLVQSLTSGPAGSVEVYRETMDLARFGSDTYLQLLRDHLRAKYAAKKIDVVVAVMGPALDFLLSEGAPVFPGARIVFCGIDRREIEGRALTRHVTGVFLKREFAPTLEVALRIHPDTTRAVFVAGTSEFDARLVEQARGEFRSYEDRLAFTYLTTLSVRELLAELANLPPHTIVLYSTMFRDGAGEAFVPHEVAERIAAAANAPVYGFLDQFLGRGIVGGQLYSLDAHGKQAADLARQILAGKRPSELPLRDGDSRSVSVRLAANGTMGYQREPVARGQHDPVQAGGHVGAVQTSYPRRQPARAAAERVHSRAADPANPRQAYRAGPARKRRTVPSDGGYRSGAGVEVGHSQSVRLRQSTLAGVHGANDGAGARQRLVGRHLAGRPGPLPVARASRRSRRASHSKWSSGFAGPTGQYRWVLDTGVPRYGPDGSFLGYIGSCLDITDRKASEDALRESQQRYSMATTAGALGVWDWNFATNELYVDATLKSLLGFADAEITSRPDDWGSRVHPQDLPAAAAQVKACIDGATDVYEIEHRMLHKDGSVKWFLSRGSAMRGMDGTLHRLVGTKVDITERKRAEDVIRESEAALQASNQRDSAPGRVADHRPGRRAGANRARPSRRRQPAARRAVHRAQRSQATHEGSVAGPGAGDGRVTRSSSGPSHLRKASGAFHTICIPTCSSTAA